MVSKKMYVHFPDDVRLTRSRKRHGDYSPLTRDEDNKLGQVTLQEIPDDETEPIVIYTPAPEDGNQPDAEQRELQELIEALLLLATISAVNTAKPHVTRWWNEKAAPWLHGAYDRVMRKRRHQGRHSARQETVVIELTPSVVSPEVVVAVDEYRTRMSSDEARERLVTAIVARQFSDAQLVILSNASIDDRDMLAEAGSAAEALTPEELAASLTLLLERSPSLLDSDALAALADVLSNIRGSGYVALPRERVRHALELTQ